MKLRNAIIIPNGVDGLWLNNPAIYPKSINKDHIKILFIGRIYSNKICIIYLQLLIIMKIGN